MPNWKLTVCALSCALALSACQSPSSPEVAACPQLAPVPAAVMVPREPTFSQRLLMILSPSQPTPMPSSGN